MLFICGFMKLHNIPADEIRSEWVCVSSGFVGWRLLFLIACKDGGLYFYQVWDPEPCLSIPISTILEIVDFATPYSSRQDHDLRLQIKISIPPNRSMISALFQGVQVNLPNVLLAAKMLTAMMPAREKRAPQVQLERLKSQVARYFSERKRKPSGPGARRRARLGVSRLHGRSRVLSAVSRTFVSHAFPDAPVCTGHR